MTQLVLIRHGQASFGTANYDRLSEIGERQARLVGRHLAASGQRFDVLIAGTMQRQQRSAELVNEAFDDAPAIHTEAAFNEYDADAIFAAYTPRVFADNPELGAARNQLKTDRRLFQKVFEQVTRHWLAGTPHEHDGCESWLDFKARVQTALEKLRGEYPKDARIGLCSSGGPIAISIATATGAPDAKAIEINWSVYNAAVAELRSTRDGWRMLAFNDIAALRAAGDDSLVTFR
jgi:broad specificity phosphatase PhoE